MPERLLIPDDGPDGEPTHDHELARKVGRAELARRLLLGFLVIGLSVLLIMAAVVIVQVHQTQLEGTPTGQKLLASADRILDCTDVQGECAKRNSARTAAAVADLTDNLTRVVVLASACSADLPERLSVREREVAIQACIIDRLAREKP